MCDQLHISIKQTHSFIKVFISFTFFIFLTIENAQACSCKYSKTIKEEINRSTLIFKGTPVTADTIGVIIRLNKNDTLNYMQIRFKFVVDNYFKGGDNSDTVKLITGLGGGDCGFQFRIGENYLVYANTQTVEEYNLNLLSDPKWNKSSRLKYTSKIYFETNMCTWTNLFRQEEESILEKNLNKLKLGS